LLKGKLMKINWKMGIAAVVIVATAYLATSAVRPTTYSGTGLDFLVGRGVVTVTNAAKDAVPVQLTGTGSSVFTLVSQTEGVAGSSVKQTSGSTTTQVLDFSQPAGATTFSVTKGTRVKYIGGAENALQASVDPVTADEARNIGIAAIVVILASLYYISAQNEHAFVRKLVRRELPVPVVVPVVEAAAGTSNVGRDGRMYSNYGTKD
jgi:hypothetical protein